MHSLVLTVHSFTKPSAPDNEIKLFRITEGTIKHLNYWKRQIRNKQAILPQETNWVPRVINDALITLDVWPSNVLKHEPSDIAHIFTVLSPEAVMTHWSTGENSTDQMPLLCPLRTTTETRSGSLHMQAVRSWNLEKKSYTKMNHKSQQEVFVIC